LPSQPAGRPTLVSTPERPEKAIYTEVNIELEGIKMVSGQPGPGQYPMYQQPYQPPHRTAGDMIKSLVSDTMIALALVVGLFLVMIGSWLMGLMDTDGGVNAGQVVKSLGVFLLVAGSLLGAVLRHDLDKYIRAALLLFAGALIIFVNFWWVYTEMGIF
jgi:hypothetical protein